MKARADALLIFLIVLTVAGLIVTWVSKVRQAAFLAQCQNNLRAIGMGLNAYHDQYQHFPTGTLANPNLPPEKRFSWLIEIWPRFIEAGPVTFFFRSKAWDAPGNYPPRFRLFDSTSGEQIGGECLVGKLDAILCPANPVDVDPLLPGPTHYLGIAGLGEGAADLPLLDPKAGMFGYNRKVSLSNLKHGAATTMAAAESSDGGHWTAGGQSTIRGIILEKVPYTGMAGQFASNHGGGTNFLFADGSVRAFTAALSPEQVESLATLGGENAVEIEN